MSAGVMSGPRQRVLTDWLSNQPREDVLLVVFGDGGDDGRQRRHIVDLVLFRKLGSQCVEVDVLPRTGRVSGCLVIFDQGAGDVCAAPEEPFVLWWEIRILLAQRRGYCCRRHCGVFVGRPSPMQRFKSSWFDFSAVEVLVLLCLLAIQLSSFGDVVDKLPRVQRSGIFWRGKSRSSQSQQLHSRRRRVCIGSTHKLRQAVSGTKPPRAAFEGRCRERGP